MAESRENLIKAIRQAAISRINTDPERVLLRLQEELPDTTEGEYETILRTEMVRELVVQSGNDYGAIDDLRAIVAHTPEIKFEVIVTEVNLKR